MKAGPSSLRVAFVLAAPLLSGLAGCVEPVQNGGVVMYGNESSRIAAMCRFRRGEEGKEGFCLPEAEPVRVAEIKEREGGDLVLDNGEIVVVIGGPKSSAYGAIVDAVEAHVGEDSVDRVTTCFDAPLGCVVTSELLRGKEADGSAWIVARGKPQGDPRISVATRYLLAAGSRVLVVTTKVVLQAEEPVALPAFVDVARWSAADEVFRGGFVMAVGRRVAYGVAPAGVDNKLELVRGADGTSLRFIGDATLKPGQAASYERHFAVSPRGDTLGVRTELALSRESRAPGAIEVRFVSADGKPVPPPARGLVELGSSSELAEVFGSLQIDQAMAEQAVAAEAPPGHYELDLRAAGVRALSRVPVDVRSGEVSSVTMTIGAEASAPAP